MGGSHGTLQDSRPDLQEAPVEQLRGSGLDEALNAEREAVLSRWVEVVETGSRGRISRAELTTELAGDPRRAVGVPEIGVGNSG